MIRRALTLAFALTTPTGVSAQTLEPVWKIDAFSTPFVQVPFTVAVARPCEFWLGDGNGEIQVVDCDADLVTTIGRKGEGPGEYTWPRNLTASGGSVVVWDQVQQRATVIDADTREHTRVVPAQHVFDQAGGPTGKAGSVGGQLFVEIDGKPRGQPRRFGSSFVLWSLGSTAPDDQDHLVIDGPEYVSESGQFNTMAYHDPGSARYVWDTSRTSLVVANALNGTVRKYTDLTAQPEMLTLDIPSLPVSRSAFDGYLQSLEDAFEAELARQSLGPDFRRTFRARFARIQSRIPQPEAWPVLKAIYVDSSEDIAVVQLFGSEPWADPFSSQWAVVSLTDGSLLSSFTTEHTGEVIDAAVSGTQFVTLEVDAEDYGTRRLSLYDLSGVR